MVVEIKLREEEPRSAQLTTDWSILPGDQGRPTLAPITPGGTVSLGHRNISSLNRSLAGSLTFRNLLNPKIRDFPMLFAGSHERNFSNSRKVQRCRRWQWEIRRFTSGHVDRLIQDCLHSLMFR